MVTYYVQTDIGNDSNNGTSEETPFKTLSKAISTASNDDMINLLQGYMHFDEFKNTDIVHPNPYYGLLKKIDEVWFPYIEVDTGEIS